MLKINGLEADLVICGNTETLRPIWGDIFEAANWYDTSDFDEAISVVWHKAFEAWLWSAFGSDSDWRTESSFEYWNGGPGSGSYRLSQQDQGFPHEFVALAAAHADEFAREAARDEVAVMLACQEEEA